MTYLSILLRLCCLVIIFAATPVLAANDLSGAVSTQLQAGAAGAEIGTPVDPRIIIAQIIQVSLTMIGTIFMGLIILSGYWWLTDRGEGQRIEKAKKTLPAAVIGLVVILISYAITLYVGRLVQQSVQGDRLTPQGASVTCNVFDLVRGTCARGAGNYSEEF